jgi:hypothetical protein
MEIWSISQIIEVVVLSHTNGATSLTLARSMNSKIGIETLEGLRTVCNLIPRDSSKSFNDPSRSNGNRYILHNCGRIL